MRADPAELFRPPLVVTIPHMDDGVLACGGSIARLPDKSRVHLVYASDGMGSPEPVLPWIDRVSPDLGEIRAEEAREAMGHLGVDPGNIHFLGLPDGRLESHPDELDGRLHELLARLSPATVATPFRYDRHRDHVALNGSVMRARRNGALDAEILEYFVYHQSRLLPRRDIRRYIRPELLHQVEIAEVAERKRSALSRFRSQTTVFYPWQTRPNLTAQLLDRASREPEIFLRYDESLPGSRVFSGPVFWIRLSHRAEPLLKRRKDRAMAILRRYAKR